MQFCHVKGGKNALNRQKGEKEKDDGDEEEEEEEVRDQETDL